MNSKTKIIGSTLILIGTTIGAGMLALPMIAAKAGFIPAAILMLFIWALMATSALLTLEVNLALPTMRNSFQSMAKATLGPIGQAVAWIACLALLYSLTAAYISGNSSLISEALITNGYHVSDKLNAIIFTLIFGGIVFWSTKAVDVLNRGLMSLKGIMLIVVLAVLVPHLNIAKLVTQQTHARYLWIAAPIFITAFGFHTVIPSMTNYLGKENKTLRKMIIVGITIPLVIYLIWLACVLAIVPLAGNESFTAIAAQHGSVGGLVATIDAIIHSKIVTIGVNAFSDIAMTTSFLGVTLGLFDFLADGFKRKNSRVGRLQTALITFIPPLIFALFYPKGFILALGYAAIFVAVLLVCMPALMAYKLRKSKKLTSSYRVSGGTSLLAIVFLAGILLIAIQCYLSF